jgi:hypothetical protein
VANMAFIKMVCLIYLIGSLKLFNKCGGFIGKPFENQPI